MDRECKNVNTVVLSKMEQVGRLMRKMAVKNDEVKATVSHGDMKHLIQAKKIFP